MSGPQKVSTPGSDIWDETRVIYRKLPERWRPAPRPAPGSPAISRADSWPLDPPTPPGSRKQRAVRSRAFCGARGARGARPYISRQSSSPAIGSRLPSYARFRLSPRAPRSRSRDRAPRSRGQRPKAAGSPKRSPGKGKAESRGVSSASTAEYSHTGTSRQRHTPEVCSARQTRPAEIRGAVL